MSLRNVSEVSQSSLWQRSEPRNSWLSATHFVLELPLLLEMGQSPQVPFLTILICTCDSVNAKHSYRPCTYTPTFTALAICSSLSLPCQDTGSSPDAESSVSFLQSLRQNVSNHHSPTDCTLSSFPSSPSHSTTIQLGQGSHDTV